MGKRRSGPERLRAWRLKQGWSAEVLGKRVGRTGSLMLKIERGDEPATLTIALALARLSGIPVGRLLSKRQRAEVREAARQLPRAA